MAWDPDSLTASAPNAPAATSAAWDPDAHIDAALGPVNVTAKRIGPSDDFSGPPDEGDVWKQAWNISKTVGKQLLGGALDAGRMMTGETQQQAESNETKLGLAPSTDPSQQNVRSIGGFAAPTPTAPIGEAATVATATARDAANAVLKNAGVDTDRAQQTGGKWWQTAKNVVTDNPFFGDNGFSQQQGKQFTKAALNLVGEDSDTASASVMGVAKTRIGTAFNDVFDNNSVNMNAPGKRNLLNDLANTEADASNDLNPTQLGLLQKQISKLMDSAADNGGNIPGRVAQNVKMTLDRLSMGADSAVGHYARQIRENLLDALQQSVSPGDYSKLTTARTQWRAMEQVAGSIDKNDQVPATALFRTMDTLKNAQQSVYGKGDQSLMKLAQAGAQILPDAANSGTARRAASLASVSAIGAAVTEAYHGDYKSAAGLGLMGFLGVPGLRAVLQHPELGSKIGPLIEQNLKKTPALAMAVQNYKNANPQQARGQNQALAPPQQDSSAAQ